MGEHIAGLPFLASRFDRIAEPTEETAEIEALANHVRAGTEDALELIQQAPAEIATSLRQIESAGVLADLVASLFDFKPAEKQSLLSTIELKPRLERLVELMSHRRGTGRRADLLLQPGRRVGV
jgi:ATP-dependent Lon protease